MAVAFAATCAWLHSSARPGGDVLSTCGSDHASRPRQLFGQRLHNIWWSISSTECGEIPSCPNPGISGEDTLSTCISST
jgi:hypothetical protein